MAKKKRSIELVDQNITYDVDEGVVKVIRLDPNTMTVDVNVHVEGQKARPERIRFAQLPKHIKKLVRPL